MWRLSVHVHVITFDIK
jgi:hypothetical protein